MDAQDKSPATGRHPTNVERTSDRELVVTRLFDAPPHIVFAAWTTPDLFKRWWAPQSMGVPLSACAMDVRPGGGYSVTFGADPADAMTFFGKYLEVVPGERLVWTNEEDPDGSVTTVTFEAQGDRTLLTMHELYPSKEALDASLGSIMPEQFDQLDDLLAEQGHRAGGS